MTQTLTAKTAATMTILELRQLRHNLAEDGEDTALVEAIIAKREAAIAPYVAAVAARQERVKASIREACAATAAKVKMSREELVRSGIERANIRRNQIEDDMRIACAVRM